tara:strand:- start:1761 stop:3404 length:1644 start_codon:yes stop_codon:yes gene_type:complete
MASHTAPNVPSPQQRLNALRFHFNARGTSDLDVLKHCLGITPINNIPPIANALSQHIILVCVDTEHWTLNSNEMTEVGVGVLRMQHALSISGPANYGEHGENMMQMARQYFYRIIEKTHLPTTNPRSHGPKGNRFGETRFVTFYQMRIILRQILVEPIKNVNGLQGCNHPIVMLGQALSHDTEHLNGQDLAFDVRQIGTIVKYIDTQNLVREAGYWTNNRDGIGLLKLIDALEFSHADAHTAANDAARTMMAAVTLALPKSAKQGCSRSMARVAADLEQWSHNTFVSLGGYSQYCWKCGSTNHDIDHCTATGLRCSECVSRGYTQQATEHISRHCPLVRDEVAEERKKWFASRDHAGIKPKHRFVSHLQKFAPNAPNAPPATNEEVQARFTWYARQRLDNPNQRPQPFTWKGRSYEQSSYVLGSRSRNPLPDSTHTPPPAPPVGVPPSSAPSGPQNPFRPLPTVNTPTRGNWGGIGTGASLFGHGRGGFGLPAHVGDAQPLQGGRGSDGNRNPAGRGVRGGRGGRGGRGERGGGGGGGGGGDGDVAW